MSTPPNAWAQMVIVDPRPVWTGKLANTLSQEGFFGDIKTVVSKHQLLRERAPSGPTLYLIGNVTFERSGIPDDVLALWAATPCKVVFLANDPSVFAADLNRKGIDFADRAVDSGQSDMPLQTIARKLLQFEPAPHQQTPSGIERQVEAAPLLQAAKTRTSPPNGPSKGPRRISVIGLGASTGGVEALQTVLSGLPATLPPILIVQHSRSKATTALAKVLDRASKIDVVSAENNMKLLSGHAYLAAGQAQHLRLRLAGNMTVQLIDAPSVSGHRPSVDVLFDSLSDLGNQAAAVLLTGMGQDGAAGLKRIRDRGGWTAAQDKASSVVYGMPKAAAECGAAQEQLSLRNVAPRLEELCQR